MEVKSIVTTKQYQKGATFYDVEGTGIRDQMFPTSETYDLYYTGEVARLNAVKTATGTYFASMQANLVFRRSSTPNNDIVWYQAVGSSTDDSLTLKGPAVTGNNEAFGGNNVNIGVDNVFANRSDINGNFTNIERVDFVYTAGLTSTASRGFTVLDRGNVGDHDSFGIVAITGIDGAGNPTAYGTLKQFGTGNWGNTALAPQTNYIILRKDNDTDQGFAPAASATNSLGGVFVPLTDLAGAGTKIYGYSLVGGDVTQSGNALVNWMNPSVFPTNTLHDNVEGSKTSPGGLDPTGTFSLLFDAVAPTLVAVPEPSVVTLVMSGAMLLLRRRR